jgi:hypothetical protein
LNGREYLEILKTADPTRNSLKKKRTAFIHEGLCYIIDEILNVEGRPVILTTGTDTESEKMVMPPFLDVNHEILNVDTAYHTHNLSIKDYKLPKCHKNDCLSKRSVV